MSRADDAERARRKAHDLLSGVQRKDQERLAARDRLREAEALKTARLRELRLARDAAHKADKESVGTPPVRGDR